MWSTAMRAGSTSLTTDCSGRKEPERSRLTISLTKNGFLSKQDAAQPGATKRPEEQEQQRLELHGLEPGPVLLPQEPESGQRCSTRPEPALDRAPCGSRKTLRSPKLKELQAQKSGRVS